MTSINKLNYDCLAQIFEYFGPKEWLSFSKVNTKWSVATDFVWKDKLKLEFICSSEFEKIKKDVQQITLRDTIEIMKKSGHKLREISLLIHDDFNEKNVKVLCYIGKHRYYMARKFKLKSLVKVLSTVSQNIVTLKVRAIEASDQLIWTKLLQRNKDLASFELSVAEFSPQIRKFLLSLPTSLDRLKLKFRVVCNSEYNQVLEKQLNLSHVHITACQFSENIMTILFKHEKSLKSLCLDKIRHPAKATIMNNDPALDDAKLTAISKFNHLEKIHLSGFSSIKNDVLLSILNGCEKLRDLKLGHQYLSQDVLTAIMSLPKLEKLHLKRLTNFTKLPSPVGTKNLKTLIIDLQSSQTVFNWQDLCNVIKKMPVLAHLRIEELSHDFCDNGLFTFINVVLSLDKYVIIKPLTVSDNRQESFFFSFIDVHIENLSQIKIHKDSLTSKSENSFTLTIGRDCIRNFVRKYRCNPTFLPNCNVFKQECGKFVQLFPLVESDDNTSEFDSNDSIEDFSEMESDEFPLNFLVPFRRYHYGWYASSEFESSSSNDSYNDSDNEPNDSYNDPDDSDV